MTSTKRGTHTSATVVEHAALNTLTAYTEAVAAMRVWINERQALKQTLTKPGAKDLLPPDLAFFAENVRTLPGPWTKASVEVVDLMDSLDHRNVTAAYASHYRLGTTTANSDPNT